MGILVKKDRPVQFSTDADRVDGLLGFFGKVAGPRTDGKPTELHYVATKLGIVQGEMDSGTSTQAELKAELKKAQGILYDLSRDLQYAAQVVRKIGQGNGKRQNG